MPENLQLILGMTDEKLYVPRVQAVHRLGSNLPEEHIKAITDFLFQKIATQEFPDLKFNGLKNELTWVLIKQRKPPVDLAVNLIRMFEDKSYDETWRDYCIQFCAKYYPYTPSKNDKKIMAQALFDATKERDGRIAGTAGYMLVHMLKYPGFQPEAVKEAVFAAIDDPACSELSKVALLQAGAELNDDRFLPQAREYAAKSRNIPLRMSAIAAVGILGDKSDLELLEKLSESPDIRIQKPARVAIEKISRCY